MFYTLLGSGMSIPLKPNDICAMKNILSVVLRQVLPTASVSVLFLSSCGVFGGRSTELSCPANVSASSNASRGSSRETNCPSNVYVFYAPEEKTKKNCPPAAFGAEKLLKYMDKYDTKHPTDKIDPVTGKVTTEKKGLRTGEIEKNKKQKEAEKSLSIRERRENKLIERQIRRDEKEANKTGIDFFK